MPRIIDYWRSIPPEQKELFFLGVHSAAAFLIYKAIRASGGKLLATVMERPGLVLLGLAGGKIYYEVLKRIIGRGSE